MNMEYTKANHVLSSIARMNTSFVLNYIKPNMMTIIIAMSPLLSLCYINCNI